MKSKIPIIIGLSLMFILTLSFAALTFVKEMNKPKLPVIGQVKPFTLLDQSGKDFSLNDLLGKVWVANFFFTTCSDICPIMSKNMASLSRSFALEGGVKLVSVTVNPETDNSQTLSNYAVKNKYTNNNWFFLTGSREKIREIVLNSFKLGSIEEPIFHSSYFALVDRYGYIRGYYDGTDKASLNKIFKDSAKLLKDH